MPTSPVIDIVSQVPYVAHSGVDLLASGPGWAIAALDQQERHTSHSGSFQGAAIYSVAEAAASLVVAGVTEQAPNVAFAIFQASITFSRPLHGRVVANATLAEPLDKVRARLHRDGAVSFAVVARLAGGEGEDAGRAEFGCRIVLPAESGTLAASQEKLPVPVR